MHWSSDSPANHEGSAFPWFNISKKSDKYDVDQGHSQQFDYVTIISLPQHKKTQEHVAFLCG